MAESMAESMARPGRLLLEVLQGLHPCLVLTNDRPHAAIQGARSSHNNNAQKAWALRLPAAESLMSVGILGNTSPFFILKNGMGRATCTRAVATPLWRLGVLRADDLVC